MSKPDKPADATQASASIEAAKKELVEAYRRYAQDARQGIEAPAATLTHEDLEREYARLERRFRLVRKQLERVFGKEGQFVEAQLPGLHVELKLAAEQASRAYAMLAALDRGQALNPVQADEQLLEGGKYPLLNVGPLEAARVLDELDAARRQPPPYCYVVTAVYGPHSRELARAHARCGPVFRSGPWLLRQGWRSYQFAGPRFAGWVRASPRFGRGAIRLVLARPILRAAGRPGLGRGAARLLNAAFARGDLPASSVLGVTANA